MRAILALVVIAACKGTPSPPDPKAFAAMTPEAKCEAVAPRATQCMDELLVADLNSVGMDPTVTKQLDNEPRATSDEAAVMHKNRCLGTATYPAAVVACWSTESCKAFVDCVLRTEKKP